MVVLYYSLVDGLWSVGTLGEGAYVFIGGGQPAGKSKLRKI